MSKRFTDTELWNEDWFISLPTAYQLFWLYLKDKCDHLGIWRPNLMSFQKIYGHEIKLKIAVEKFNEGKERVIELEGGRLWLTGFIPFQYGVELNDKSKVHMSVIQGLSCHRLSIDLCKPIVRLKDKDKDKDSLVVVVKKGGVGENKETSEITGPTPEQLINLWNNAAHPNLPRVEILTEKRKTHIKARLKEHPEKEFWDSLLQRINKSPLLIGENSHGWKCNFDWILNVNNMAKILEGNYDNDKRRM